VFPPVASGTSGQIAAALAMFTAVVVIDLEDGRTKAVAWRDTRAKARVVEKVDSFMVFQKTEECESLYPFSVYCLQRH